MIENKKILELLNKYHENTFSHAFLLVTNDIQKCHDDVIKLIKQISCTQEYSDNCSKCNICYQIDHNVLPNILDIYPDNQSIKKNQIQFLKDRFKTKPDLIKNNIYIINYAEKMNVSAANTMLKFLEEPEDNIIGFFITTNKDTMLDTIKSRCQIINAVYNNQNILSLMNISSDKLDFYRNIASTYLRGILANQGIIINKKVILSEISKREEILTLFTYIYYLLDYIIRDKDINESFVFLKDKSKAELLEIQKKVYSCFKSINFNVNIELLLDNFVLELEALR